MAFLVMLTTIWLVCHGRLYTLVRLHSFGIAQTTHCFCVWVGLRQIIICFFNVITLVIFLITCWLPWMSMLTSINNGLLSLLKYTRLRTLLQEQCLFLLGKFSLTTSGMNETPVLMIKVSNFFMLLRLIFIPALLLQHGFPNFCVVGLKFIFGFLRFSFGFLFAQTLFEWLSFSNQL